MSQNKDDLSFIILSKEKKIENTMPDFSKIALSISMWTCKNWSLRKKIFKATFIFLWKSFAQNCGLSRKYILLSHENP